MADIKYTVVFDSKTAAEAAVKLDQAVGGMGKTAGVAHPAFSGLWKEVFGGVTIAGLAKDAVGKFTDFIKDSIKAAADAEKANANLKSALGATGREVEANAKHFIERAKAVQKSTIYDDDAVKSAQALLIQLTSLDRDGIDRATKGAIGLASVLGIDLQSATMMVIKGTEGNTAALGRYGIKVKETGTAEEKRNELLQKLDGFYKRATDATGTFAGKTAQLKNNLGELKETVGGAIIENERLQKTVADLSLAFQYLSEHGGILKTAIDGIFQGLLGPGGMLLMKLLGGLADKQREINKAQEEGQKWADKYNQELIKLGKSGVDLSKNPLLAFMVSLCKETKEGHAAFHVTDEYAKQFGITLKTKVIEQINDTRLALQRLKTSGEATPGAIAALEKKLKDLIQYLTGAKTAAASCGIALTKTLVPAARSLNDVFAKTPVVVAQAYVRSASALSVWVKKNKDAIETVVAFSQQALGLIQSAYNNYYANQTAKLDEESRKKQEAMDADYERRRADIENSTLSEAEKQTALAALDKEYKDLKEAAEKEYEAKRKKLQKEAAEKDRAVAIVQAVINTAVAVSKALPNLILVAFAAAMGAAQVAIIASQKIPLAKGAMFDRPTLLAGGRYEVGEAGKEAALPVEPLLKRIDAMILRGLALKGSGQVLVQVFIGQEELDKRIIRVTKREGSLGRLKLDSKVVS